LLPVAVVVVLPVSLEVLLEVPLLEVPLLEVVLLEVLLEVELVPPPEPQPETSVTTMSAIKALLDLIIGYPRRN
jgi:hypothetical protein